MKNYLLILLVGATCFSVACTRQKDNNRQQVQTKTNVFRYTNPVTRDTSISMRDHCIIKVGEKWYCTGTSNPVWTGPNPGVRLLVSDDLIHWKQHSWLIDAGKLPDDCPFNGFGLLRFIIFRENTGSR